MRRGPGPHVATIGADRQVRVMLPPPVPDQFLRGVFAEGFEACLARDYPIGAAPRQDRHEPAAHRGHVAALDPRRKAQLNTIWVVFRARWRAFEEDVGWAKHQLTWGLSLAHRTQPISAILVYREPGAVLSDGRKALKIAFCHFRVPSNQGVGLWRFRGTKRLVVRYAAMPATSNVYQFVFFRIFKVLRSVALSP